MIIVIYYFLTLFLDIFFATLDEVCKYGSNEYYSVVDIFYLYLFYKIGHKMIFYSHQNLALVIIAIMELIRYFYKIFFFNKFSFDFPMDLLSLLPLIVFPFLDALQNYYSKKFMKYYYFSPYHIILLIGFIYVIISYVLYFSFTFSNFNCGELYFCSALNEKKYISGTIISFYIIQYFLNLLCFFIRLLVIYNYSVFHLMISFSFNVSINSIFSLVINYTNEEFITFIITFPFEIFSIFIFLEIIELNFCNLNANTKRNIMKRANKEGNLILDINEEDDSFGVDIPNDGENNIQNESGDSSNIYD